MIKKYYFYFLFFQVMLTDLRSSTSCCTNNICDVPYHTLFLPLSVTQNLYTQYHKYNQNVINFSATYRFTQAYNNNEIIESVLLHNPMFFVGSVAGVEARPSNALIAEYFGLAPDTYTGLNLHPQIRNQVIDVQLAMQAKNCWFQVNLPLVKAQWQVNTNVINNMYPGTMPLQDEGSIYIYNIGTTMNTITAVAPPANRGSEDAPVPDNGYNVLPPQTTISGPANYNGAYIFSTQDASKNDTYEGDTIFTVADMNTGYTNVNDQLNENLTITDELSENNWVLGVGLWPTVTYTPYAYSAAYTYTDTESSGNVTVPASMTSEADIVLSGSITDISEEGNNAILITQKELKPAHNIVEALNGSYDFNGLLKRKYCNINLLPDTTIENWQIGDIILWLGYDISRCGKNHIGLYLHGVVPTGTLINEQWNQYVFNPVVGNGHHGQLGIGFSGSYAWCQNQCYDLTLTANGYVDHVFATKQFRVFDVTNQPMSRYAIVKALRYTEASNSNDFNDDFEYQYLTTVGNVNGATLEVNNDIKGEFIFDISYDSDRISAGIGYAFSGLSSDKLTCNNEKHNMPDTNFIINQIYYGYKGMTTPISSLIISNITASQESVTPENECPLTPTAQCSYPLAFQFQNIPTGIFPEALPAGNIIYVKSCGDVTENGNSGVYIDGQSVGSGESTGESYDGTTEADVFALPNFAGNNSALLGPQILNRIFAHADFVWETNYFPTIGIVGSYGFGSVKYFTPLYWDIGCYFAFSF